MTNIQTPKSDALSDAIERNVSALMRHDQEVARRATLQQRLADRITSFAGSMGFVYSHVLIVCSWVLINLQVLPIARAWDPTFVVLAMVASVEAIFISTFVLISQNKMAEIAERRAQLNLQISLLAEHETTKMMSVVTAIAQKLEVTTPVDREVQDLQRDVEPEAVLSRLEAETVESHTQGVTNRNRI
jgi:uncharacterized membrane protein